MRPKWWSGKPAGWLKGQVLKMADSGVNLDELLNHWCGKGVSKKRLREWLRNSKHPLSREWQRRNEDEYPEITAPCHICGEMLHVKETQNDDDGWLDLRVKLSSHVREVHPSRNRALELEWWDAHGEWEWKEAPAIQRKVEAVRAQEEQRQAQQDEAQAREDLEQDEDDGWRGVQLAMPWMQRIRDAIDAGGSAHAPVAEGAVEGEC